MKAFIFIVVISVVLADSCYDKLSSSYCRRNSCKVSWMKKYCPKTCKQCGSTGTGGTGTGGGIKILKQKDLCLQTHNSYRRKHLNTKDLVWDDQLAAGAEKYAEELAKRGGLKHSRGKYGENLYAAGGFTADFSDACKKASDSWYSEVKLYDFNNPGYKQGVGHFTQMVWRASTKLGVGIAQIGRKVYVVARYTPQGNFLGRFADNVMRKTS